MASIEVVAEIADLGLGIACGIYHKLIFGGELARGCRDGNCGDEFQKGFGYRLNFRTLLRR
jgi:hypothetical protein